MHFFRIIFSLYSVFDRLLVGSFYTKQAHTHFETIVKNATNKNCVINIKTSVNMYTVKIAACQPSARLILRAPKLRPTDRPSNREPIAAIHCVTFSNHYVFLFSAVSAAFQSRLAAVYSEASKCMFPVHSKVALSSSSSFLQIYCRRSVTTRATMASGQRLMTYLLWLLFAFAATFLHTPVRFRSHSHSLATHSEQCVYRWFVARQSLICLSEIDGFPHQQ